MKKTTFLQISLAAGLMLALAACQSAPVPRTVEGRVMDATMNNITLIASTGDTLNISTMDADPAKVPGVLIDDSVKITYQPTPVGGAEVKQAVELTVLAHSPYYYIQGTWTEPNPIDSAQRQGVTLNPDGTAASVGMATLVFRNWTLNLPDTLLLGTQSLGNGQTIESTDTLQVVKLDADSLVLAGQGNVVWRFARQK